MVDVRPGKKRVTIMTESKQTKEHPPKHHNEKHLTKESHAHEAKTHVVHKAAEVSHHPETKKQTEIKITLPELKGVRLSTLTTIAAVILLALVVFQTFQTYSLAKKVDAMSAEREELSKLPIVEVTGIDIISAACAECTPLTSLLGPVKSARLNITKELTGDYKSEASQQLITKYGITRLPTVIIAGEIDKVSLPGFTKTDNALIYSGTPPPYVDASTGKVKGLVSLTYVNASSCRECQDLTPAVQRLRTLIKVADFKVIDKDSQEGKKLVAEYDMARLPGLLISSEVNEYPLAAQLVLAGGTVKKNGTIALGANAPYLNVSAGKVAGITRVILLNDSSCAGCYDVTMHLPILKRFQVYTGSMKAVDAASVDGKDLISKYKITAVPTIIVTGDASAYPELVGIWPSVGTTEKDGALVFRTMSAIAGRPYRNLQTGGLEQNLPQQQTPSQE